MPTACAGCVVDDRVGQRVVEKGGALGPLPVLAGRRKGPARQVGPHPPVILGKGGEKLCRVALRVERLEGAEAPGHRRARRLRTRSPPRHRHPDRLAEFVEFRFHPDPFNPRGGSLHLLGASYRVAERRTRGFCTRQDAPDAVVEPNDCFPVKLPARFDPKPILESRHADPVSVSAAAGGEDARLGAAARRGRPRAGDHRPRDNGRGRAGDRDGRRRLRHDPAEPAGARRQTALAAGPAGGAAGRVLLPGTDRAPGRHHQFPRDLQRPYRGAHHELRARLRARAANLYPAAIAPRMAADGARERRYRHPSARGDGADHRGRRHRRRDRAARGVVRHDM